MLTLLLFVLAADDPNIHLNPFDMIPAHAGAVVLTGLDSNNNGPLGVYKVGSYDFQLLVSKDEELSCRTSRGKASALKVRDQKACLFSTPEEPEKTELLLTWVRGKFSFSIDARVASKDLPVATKGLLSVAAFVDSWDEALLDAEGLSSDSLLNNRSAQLPLFEAAKKRRAQNDKDAPPEVVAARRKFRSITHWIDWFK